MLALLSEKYNYPVDIEFTVNFDKTGEFRVNLLQCRPLQTRGLGRTVELPEKVDEESSLFYSSGNFMGGILIGYLAGIFGRFVFATISGVVFFGEYAWEGWSPIAYSIVYNAIYIFAEGAITVLILLVPTVRMQLQRVKNMAVE